MTQISQSALLPYSAQQVFDLVADIEAYPGFMQGCTGATILNQQGNIVEARLDVGQGSLKQSFSTRNVAEEPDKICLELIEGPFEHFQGEWLFYSLQSDACKVSLELSFRLNSVLSRITPDSFFQSAAGNLVNALCQRANQLYGVSGLEQR